MEPITADSSNLQINSDCMLLHSIQSQMLVGVSVFMSDVKIEGEGCLRRPEGQGGVVST